MPLIISPYAYSPGTMLSAIQRLGLTSGLKLCLDVSDINSYSGAGQSWLDTSGNGYDFFRGTTSGAEASDPTFNGVAGAQSASEYWSFDGGDTFTYDTTIEAWMDNLHKDSAKFTLACWYYHVAGDDVGLFGDNAAATSSVGITFRITSANLLRLQAGNGSASALGQSTSGTVSGGWNFLAVSFDEAASSLLLQINGSQEAFVVAYSSPSASSAVSTPQVAGAGGSQVLPASGARMASFQAWESVSLSAQALTDLFQSTRGKFGV